MTPSVQHWVPKPINIFIKVQCNSTPGNILNDFKGRWRKCPVNNSELLIFDFGIVLTFSQCFYNLFLIIFVK